ncbi:MAG: VOC family protein [Ginsengibacter sp.]
MNKKITTCLWFNGQAADAAEFYTKVFKNSGIRGIMRNTKSSPVGAEGTALTASFFIEDFEFLALNGGPNFKPNPSVSFFVHCANESEVNILWEKLSEGGKVMMPLDKYPFSERYGWIEDQFGISWQLMLPTRAADQKIVPCMLFVHEVFGKAKEALDFYVSVFRNASLDFISTYGDGSPYPDAINYGECTLEGEKFVVMENDSKQHEFHFNEGISFIIHCDDQDEVDYYWNILSTNGGQESQCGWLKDRYGVSWQVTPDILPKLLSQKDQQKADRAMRAMIQMKKIDIAALENAVA